MSFLCNKLISNVGRVFLHNSFITQNTVLTTVRCFTTSSRSKTGIYKLGLAGATVGALVGTGYSIHQLNKPNAHILNEQTNIPVVENVPEIKPSRKVSKINITKWRM